MRCFSNIKLRAEREYGRKLESFTGQRENFRTFNTCQTLRYTLDAPAVKSSKMAEEEGFEPPSESPR